MVTPEDIERLNRLPRPVIVHEIWDSGKGKHLYRITLTDDLARSSNQFPIYKSSIVTTNYWEAYKLAKQKGIDQEEWIFEIRMNRQSARLILERNL